jgi:asparagine synthetase B (glutamine-hydrolysing)
VTSIDVEGNLVHLRTGAMNNPPLYAVRNTTTRAWAIGTNAFTLNIARSQWGLLLGFVDPTVTNRDETTSFLGVSQLPAHSTIELKKHDSGWKFTINELHDPVFDALQPQIDDYRQAGLQFVISLQTAISEITKNDKSIAILLSGGIDSGAVATFAVRAGLKVTGYGLIALLLIMNVIWCPSSALG